MSSLFDELELPLEDVGDAAKTLAAGEGSAIGAAVNIAAAIMQKRPRRRGVRPLACRCHARPLTENKISAAALSGFEMKTELIGFGHAHQDAVANDKRFGKIDIIVMQNFSKLLN
jgi:hypothetical protein